MDSSGNSKVEPLNGHEIRHVAKILRATAHIKRVEILNTLISNPSDYANLLRRTKISRTALANHLKLLTENGLIVRTSRGSYTITEDGRGVFESIVYSYSQSQSRIKLERDRRLEKYSHRATGKKKGDQRLKVMKNLKWQSRWVSHLGCIEGCLKFMKHRISTGWLYGGTGHAFVINLSEDLCPSGPTAWRPQMLFQLAHNLGYEIKGIFAHKSQPEFPAEQEKAWEHTKEAINNQRPCYGWHVGNVPEFYVIQGYDDIGYYVSGAGSDDGTGPMKWQDVGVNDIGILEIYSILKTPESDPEVVVRESFEKVLHHATNPDEWIFDNYRSGIPAFDLWIESVQTGNSVAMGLAYNAAVWAECRKYAVEFLKEAKKKLSRELRPLIDTSLDHYQDVSKNLDLLAKLFPFSPGMSPEPIGVSSKNNDGVEYLTGARDAEEKGLESLKPIVEALSS